MGMVAHPFDVLVGRDGARKSCDWATEQREQSGAEGLFAYTYIRINSSLTRICVTRICGTTGTIRRGGIIAYSNDSSLAWI
jgi:hypothetical protein